MTQWYPNYPVLNNIYLTNIIYQIVEFIFGKRYSFINNEFHLFKVICI